MNEGDLVHVILPDGTERDWVVVSDGKGRTTLSPPPKTGPDDESDSPLARYVAADDAQHGEAKRRVAPWMRETMRKQRISHVAMEVDLIDASDPELAHGRLDELLLQVAPEEVREAAMRLMARCDWWAGA